MRAIINRGRTTNKYFVLLAKYIPAPTFSFRELSVNLNTALAASSGTKTTSVVSLCEPVESCGGIEVAGTKETGKVTKYSG